METSNVTGVKLLVIPDYSQYTYLQLTDFTQHPGSIVILSLLLAAVYFYHKPEKGKYPVGPPKLPLLGNLHQVLYCGSLVKFCEKYRQYYGNVFTFEVGIKKRVVVSGYDSIRELLVDNGQYTRTRSPDSKGKILAKHSKHTPGMIYASYPNYKTIKSMVLLTIKKEGSDLETMISQELLDYFDQFINPMLNKPINLEQGVSMATSNIISQLAIGRRFPYQDTTFIALQSRLKEFLKLTIQCGLISSLPISDSLLGRTVSKVNHYYEKLLVPTVSALLSEVKQNLDMENPRYIIERFLAHSKLSRKYYNDCCFTEENAPYLLFQLFIAGTDTTASAVRWAFLFLGSNADIKLKVVQEIDNHLGGERQACSEDMKDMPYIETVLLETLRRGCVGAIALPYTLSNECVIDGKTIPANSDVLVNLFSVLHDETVFEEPTKFKPERYLTGDIALKKQRTIPFGIGKRKCPGERIAMIELFLFLVSILQRYDFSLADPVDLSYPALDIGTVCMPLPYKIIFTVR